MPTHRTHHSIHPSSTTHAVCTPENVGLSQSKLPLKFKGPEVKTWAPYRSEDFVMRESDHGQSKVMGCTESETMPSIASEMAQQRRRAYSQGTALPIWRYRSRMSPWNLNQSGKV